MKLNKIKNRTIVTCLSALMALSNNVTRLQAYDFESMHDKIDALLTVFGKETLSNSEIQDLRAKLENCIHEYNKQKEATNEQKLQYTELASGILANLMDKLLVDLPTELQSKLKLYTSQYLLTYSHEIADKAQTKFLRVLTNKTLPHLKDTPETEVRGKTMGIGEVGQLMAIVGSLTGTLGALIGWLTTIQSLEINGNALDDLKAAAKSNSKKYPTLTWVQLKSKIPVIKNRLFESLAGQKDAIDNIIIQLNNHCTYLELCAQLNQKPQRSLVLHFYGAPGVGKSSALRIIAEELGIGVISFGMSSAVEDNGKRANTVLARLMNPDVIDTRITKAYFKTPLRKAVENPGTMIIGFDEIEKMRKLDAQISKCDYRNEEGFISPSSLDEAMRDVKDQGKFAGFDVSDKIFVTISNETDDSLKELEPSFRDRLLGSLIYFKQFDIEAYKELIIKSSRLLFDAYREEDIELSWSESALEHYANIFYKDGYSGRRVVEFIDKVSGIVQNYRDLLKYSRNWIINYNSTLDDIVIEDGSLLSLDKIVAEDNL